MGSQLNRLRMKHRRAGRVDVEALHEDTGAFLMEYEPSESVKHGEDYELEILADVWAFVAENIERKQEAEKWASYTRADWAQLEYEYVERSEYTESDLFDDILTKYERGVITADEAQAKAKEYRECDYRFCLNVFKPGRRNQWYCDADCRKREANAKIRFKQTGTYLPAHVYKDNRDDTSQENYEDNELAQDMESNEEMYMRFLYKDIFGGKRDRAREAYYHMQVFEKDLKDSQKTESKRHYNPVTNEEERAFFRLNGENFNIIRRLKDEKRVDKRHTHVQRDVTKTV